MINKKGYFDYILPQISPILLDQGFVFKKSKDSFEKKTAAGWNKVSFVFYDFALSYNINIQFLSRVNAIQEIFVKYAKINSANHKDTFSFGTSVVEAFHHNENVFRFQNIEELDKILDDKFIPFLLNFVPSLCKQYSDLEGVFHYYYTPEKKNSDFLDRRYEGHVIPIIIAKLLNLPNFDEIVTWSRNGFEKLKQKWPFSNEVFLYDTFFEVMVKELKGVMGSVSD